MPCFIVNVVSIFRLVVTICRGRRFRRCSPRRRHWQGMTRGDSGDLQTSSRSARDGVWFRVALVSGLLRVTWPQCLRAGTAGIEQYLF